MEKWEYLTRFFTASAKSDDIKTYVQQNHDKKPAKYAPEAMIPELNELGEAGWEIIHMEPVPKIGNNEDILFNHSGWSHTYFCVMKRRKAGSFVPTQAMNQPQQAAQPPQPARQTSPAPPPPAVTPPAEAAPPPTMPPVQAQAQTPTNNADLHPSTDQQTAPPRSNHHPHG